MMIRITKCATGAAIAALLLLAGATAGWAQTPCPASPNYPDFSTNQTCLVLNPVSGTTPMFAGTNPTALQITSSASNQAGAVWYRTSQIVQKGFTTSFQFQFTNPSFPPADGMAFVIQNSSAGTAAIGFTGSGGPLAYGDDDGSVNPSTGEGIPNSLAIEFDTFENAWDPQPNGNGSVSHVAVQSCGTGPNTSHHNFLCGGGSGANSTLGAPVVTANLSDGAMHSVTITYTPAAGESPANLHVKLDGTDIYPNGIVVDLSSLGLGTGGTAFVGFTGSTGGDFETQDILNWTFAPQQGQPITGTSGLTQAFVANNAPGEHVEFDFNYGVANSGGDLTIAPGTTPFVNTAGITSLQWANIVNGSAMASTTCFLASGQTDSSGNPLCATNTITCTTTASSTPSGANCPQSTVRNILFNQQIDLVQTQAGISNGTLTIPPGSALGMAELPDTLGSGLGCSFPPPPDSPLGGQLCPQSIMTQFLDLTPKGGGTGTTGNSTFVLFCCEPEWTTTATIPLWSNSTSGVPASFSSVPPPTPNPNNNAFHAAQGASVVVGGEPRGVVLDTTFPLPGEQTLPNAAGCPAPPTSWSGQTAQTFTVSGSITNFDNGTTTPAPLTEGAYDAHYFSVDCDQFEELVYPATLNVTPGTPGPNELRFKTVPFNIDTTAPTIGAITLNPPSGPYSLNSGVTASFTCADPTSNGVASGIAGCGNKVTPSGTTTGPASQTVTNFSVPTSSAGPHTLTVFATDQAGNVSSLSTVGYQVGYCLTSTDSSGNPGFTSPVLNPGSGSVPNINSASANQAIPLQVTVTDCNGHAITNLTPPGVTFAAANANVCNAYTTDNSLTTIAAGNSGWQNLGNGTYQFNWKPLPPKGACLSFSLNLGDGIQHTAYFKFK